MDLTSQLFVYSNGGLSTFMCISTSVVMMVALCLTIDNRLNLRGIITATIAGGVIVGSSSAYIYNPLEALILGAIAGGLQFIFNRIEIKLGMKPLWSNGVLFLFVVQGFLGGFLSSIFRAINKTSGEFGSLYTSLSGRLNRDQVGQIEGTFISLLLGALSGLGIFLFIRIFSIESRKTFYHDSGSWLAL